MPARKSFARVVHDALVDAHARSKSIATTLRERLASYPDNGKVEVFAGDIRAAVDDVPANGLVIVFDSDTRRTSVRLIGDGPAGDVASALMTMASTVLLADLDRQRHCDARPRPTGGASEPRLPLGQAPPSVGAPHEVLGPSTPLTARG